MEHLGMKEKKNNTEKGKIQKYTFFSQMTCPVFMYSCVLYFFFLFFLLLSGYKPAYVISVVQVMLFFKAMFYFEKGEIMF